jgi:tRNA nucleotidyltransferase (CCA-adding enzyme)
MITKVLKKVVPSSQEQREINEVGEDLIKVIKKELEAIEREVTVNIFGSISRDTWLSYEKDIDVFVRFPTTYTKKQLEDAVTSVGQRVLIKPEKRFAEHPYIRGLYHGFSVEIVPCYHVDDTSKRLSAVDRTPFHDEFVRKNLKKKQNEVRLLKQFLKGLGSYGAEAKIEGFSGYLCELLIIFYGSFEDVLKAASSWKTPIALAIQDEIDFGRFQSSPLIFIDPTDNGRNVASALNQENLSLFIYAAKEFLKSPGLSFFFPEKRRVSTPQVLKKFRLRRTHVISIKFKTFEVIDDILYSQLRKALRLLDKVFQKSGFLVINSGFFVAEEIKLIFEIQ